MAGEVVERQQWAASALIRCHAAPKPNLDGNSIITCRGSRLCRHILCSQTLYMETFSKPCSSSSSPPPPPAPLRPIAPPKRKTANGRSIMAFSPCPTRPCLALAWSTARPRTSYFDVVCCLLPQLPSAYLALHRVHSTQEESDSKTILAETLLRPCFHPKRVITRPFDRPRCLCHCLSAPSVSELRKTAGAPWPSIRFARIILHELRPCPMYLCLCAPPVPASSTPSNLLPALPSIIRTSCHTMTCIDFGDPSPHILYQSPDAL